MVARDQAQWTQHIKTESVRSKRTKRTKEELKDITHPNFSHRLAAVVANVDRHIHVLAVGVPALVQASPERHPPVVEQERLVDGALRSAAGSHADAPNATGYPGATVWRQHAVTMLQMW